MLGEMVQGGGPFGDAVNLVAPEGQDLAAELRAAVAKLPSGRYTAIEHAVEQDVREPLDIPDSVRIGALFLAKDGRIARRLPDALYDGNIVPDYEWYAPKNEKAGARIRGMIGIRTELRALMVAEQDPMNEDHHLTGYRSMLNRAYDNFVAKHGYLNSQANRLAMQDDPDYPLLQALERDYDRGISAEVARKSEVDPRPASAAKAAIFEKRVVRPRRRIESVATANEALVVSMNERGRVDMDYMVRLSGKNEETLVDELAGMIFQNPSNNGWETKDRYLTGNVKAKLKAAEAAADKSERYAGNVMALKAVQPADIEPVDIIVQLGSTWVPPSDVDAFITHLIGPVHRHLDYQPSIGKWSATIRPGNETLCKAQWGTERKPANDLIADILTRRDIHVSDVVGRHPQYGTPLYRINESETAAANQKADEIRQAFLDWIWENKERRERLARTYNDQFNTNVAPVYDGAHLELAGSSPDILLREHQKNVIWRGIQEGSTLFDHVVGAGKTYEMIAVGIESKRMGLMNKPMYVVPNHLLLQWKDAFQALYPGCNVLVAEKEDFEKTKRQRLFSRIATGDWDAVVVAHSSFKKIPLPEDTLQEILTEQINDLTQAILQAKADKGDRITIKEMEKAKDRMEAKVKRAAETGGKDDVVTFADLGVDALFIDELHEFKNLMITTSMNRISGLGNIAGSDKAFDMFVKARHLQMKQNGRGFFGGTGTPISNTIAEEYTLQRYFQYDDMRQRGIHHFDAWASVFGQVVSGWELDATGVNYKLNTRFAKFQNVPELTAMYRSFADVITKQDLVRQAAERGERPLTPPIKGGKPRNIVVDRSPLQETFMGVLVPDLNANGEEVRLADGSVRKQYTPGSIIYRMENLPKDPSIDNPLKITNEARKAGLDFRLIDPDAPDFEGSKVNHAVGEIYRIWDEWKELRGTQLVFCDLSTPKGRRGQRIIETPTPTLEREEEEGEEGPSISMDELLAAGPFSVYEDVKQKLVTRGVPEHEIRFIHDAATDAQKAKLFADMNAGRVRILLGSTPKMGAGTNVQRRLVAEHDLDAPWRPSDLEQRMGRIDRQGNMFYEQIPGFEIEIIRYATKQTYDSRMWQTIEYKAGAIEQFRRGDTLQRVIEDVASEAANAADMKAAASGNPLILLQVQINTDLKKLEAVHANWKRSRHTLESRAVQLETADIRADEKIAALRAEIAHRNTHPTEPWQFVSNNGQTFGEKKKQEIAGVVLEASKHVIEAAQKATVGESRPHRKIGEYRGYKIAVEGYRDSISFTLDGHSLHVPDNLVYRKEDEFNIGGFFTRIDNYLDRLDGREARIEVERAQEKGEFLKVREQLAKPFSQEAQLKALREDNGNVLAELRKLQADDQYVSTWLPKSTEAPQELKEAVAKALGQGAAPPEPTEVREAIEALVKAQNDPVDGLRHLKGIAFDHMAEERAEALVPALAESLKTKLTLVEHFTRFPLSMNLPVHVQEAIDRTSGYEAEEHKLAFEACKMIMGKSMALGRNLTGPVVAVSDRCVLQEVVAGVAVIHRLPDLGFQALPPVGQILTVRYEQDGKVHARSIESQSREANAITR